MTTRRPAAGRTCAAGALGSGSGPNARRIASALPAPVTRNTTSRAALSAGRVSVTRGTQWLQPGNGHRRRQPVRDREGRLAGEERRRVRVGPQAEQRPDRERRRRRDARAAARRSRPPPRRRRAHRAPAPPRARCSRGTRVSRVRSTRWWFERSSSAGTQRSSPNHSDRGAPVAQPRRGHAVRLRPASSRRRGRCGRPRGRARRSGRRPPARPPSESGGSAASRERPRPSRAGVLPPRAAHAATIRRAASSAGL